MKGTVKKTDAEIKEDILVRYQGYLRLPKRIRDQYGNPKKYPNPDVSAEETGGNLVVIYSFPLSKLPTKKRK